MSILSWVAVAVVFVTVWALIKRYETRLVLIAAGLFLCCISLAPMTGLNAFAKSMTNNSLIMAICGSMGFAYVAAYTQCDRSLVHYLAAPIRGLGIFLINEMHIIGTHQLHSFLGCKFYEMVVNLHLQRIHIVVSSLHSCLVAL